MTRTTGQISHSNGMAFPTIAIHPNILEIRDWVEAAGPSIGPGGTSVAGRDIQTLVSNSDAEWTVKVYSTKGSEDRHLLTD